MSSNRPDSIEKDLEKFVLFFALKSAQVIVQSRLGEKIKTLCNHASGYDWFNVVINDHPDVDFETKNALNLSQNETILNRLRLPLCVEISLKTVEGDQLILEVWSLELHQENKNDPLLKAAHSIYTRIGLLLKSLISVTRTTPGYKLSRRQSPESYKIYYRIYVGKAQVHALGEGYKYNRFGQISTIIGTLNMSVAYRTKMTISPTHSGRDNAIMLKSDHFLKDLSPKHVRYNHIKKVTEKKVIDLEKPLRHGAFVDASKIKQFTEEDFILPETPPFYWLIRQTKENGTDGTSQESEQDNKQSSANSPDLQTSVLSSNNNNLNSNNKNLERCGTPPIKSLFIPTEDIKKTPSRTQLLAEDENLTKELHFPFASANSHVGDLAKFYRDCYNAPKLHICEETTPEIEDGIEDLSKQLELFETSLEDYDYLVAQLACSSSKSSSNSN